MKQELIHVGAIVNAHGIRGEVKLNPVGFDPEFLAEFDRFNIGGKETEVRSSRVHKSVLLLTLPGVIVGTLLFGYFRLPGGAVGGLIAAGIVNLPVALLLLYSLRNMLEDTEYTR